jgi:mannose-6-phosphate isomerase-like protein (cupin superfamily)
MTSPTSDGRPVGRRFHLGPELQATVLTSGAETDGRHDLTHGVQPPGATTPLHVHGAYDERFWVVAGSMTVWAGAEEVALSAGDYYAVPAGTPHVVRAGPDGSVALNISSPAHFAELVERTGVPADEASERAFDPERFARSPRCRRASATSPRRPPSPP